MKALERRGLSASSGGGVASALSGPRLPEAFPVCLFSVACVSSHGCSVPVFFTFSGSELLGVKMSFINITTSVGAVDLEETERVVWFCL